jgi:citrate/tricarballylate utilization protein
VHVPPPELLPAPLLARGAQVATICNSCRYCEAYCPAFQALETRRVFKSADLVYLANLCHNCGECLYACQYAPPHEFGMDVPRVLAEARLISYEEFAWPPFMRSMFRRSGVLMSLALSAASTALLWMFVRSSSARSDFYAVIPHDVMVAIFGTAGLFVVAVLWIGFRHAFDEFRGPGLSGPATGGPERPAPRAQALSDILTLRHLHATGEDCTSDVEVRTPWRRYFHHCTFYGFALCFASTTVAAIYHVVFGWRAPYAFASAPVLLGTIGGAGLVIGPFGLLAQWNRRDPRLRDAKQRGMDVSFIVMLLMTSVTGLLLLAFRDGPDMAALLVIHLGFVLGLFVTMPYGKFVHGIYRTAALLRFSTEDRR